MNIDQVNNIMSKIRDWMYDEFGLKIDFDDRYIDSGAIDSFDMIVLIDFIEENYILKFSPGDFQDPRFFTIKGLSELVLEKTSDA
jgi:acyl carrier protein